MFYNEEFKKKIIIINASYSIILVSDQPTAVARHFQDDEDDRDKFCPGEKTEANSNPTPNNPIPD